MTDQPDISPQAAALMIRAQYDDVAMSVAVQRLLASLNVNLQAPMRKGIKLMSPTMRALRTGRGSNIQ